jgi:hypothetical protein
VTREISNGETTASSEAGGVGGGLRLSRYLPGHIRAGPMFMGASPATPSIRFNTTNNALHRGGWMFMLPDADKLAIPVLATGGLSHDHERCSSSASCATTLNFASVSSHAADNASPLLAQ